MTDVAGHAPEPTWYRDRVLVDALPAGPDDGPVAAWQSWWRVATRDRAPVSTTADLAASGVSRSAVRHAVRRGRAVSAGRGVVSLHDLAHPDPRVHARRLHAVLAAGAVLGRPDVAVSGRSAAVLHGLPTLFVPSEVELTRRARSRPGRRSARNTFTADVRDDELITWCGLAPVTCVARTLVDLARHDGADAIMAADAALAERVVDQRQITRALTRAAGWPGVRRAREVLALASPLAESPLESLVRLVLHDAGFPPPRLQAPVAGYRVERVTWDDLMHHREATLRELRRVLTRFPA